MKINNLATEITEHTEMEKEIVFLLCDLCVLCGQFSFCYGF